ncbi:cupin domain-containing protein [Methylocella sp. CPCC 101449]|uniref:helix-turn-helix domain-containing protein n=1 Tax=Methylocella sp. CPCC 101449 TaxID=2987531 RepID=UPI00288D014A|nr:cupin domain-containing protein [Methylocella sp. CPCC 101449]MDT2023165.1 helix-turn-helix domain-containing protein [Methylocella sp. CPCC 101449]
MAGKTKSGISRKQAARAGRTEAAEVDHHAGVPNEAADASAAVQFSIGSRLRSIRKMKGLTLDVLADQIGLTKGYLSKVETGQKVPPIATLARVAHALQIDVATLLQSEKGAEKAVNTGVSLIRANERHEVVRGGTAFGYDYQALAHHIDSKHMEPFIFTFPAQILREVLFEHEGEELIFVLSGKVEFQIGEEIYELSPGDCIYFDSSIPHRGRGLKGDAKAIVVICPTATSR